MAVHNRLGRATVVAALSAMALGACDTTVPLRQVEERAPLDVPVGTSLEPIEFAKVSVAVKRGKRIGGFYFALDCQVTGEHITWGSGRRTARDIEFADIFFEQLTNANYDVVGDPGRLFERREDMERARYAVGGQITDIQLNLCNALHIISAVPLGYKGEATVKVNWQVYSKLDRKVVFETVTEGRAKMAEPTFDGDLVLIQEAFAGAARNLAADPDFFRLLAEGARRRPEIQAARAAPAAAAATEIERVSPFTGPFESHIDDVRLATVTVDFGEGGFGSGFFISRSGLMLTNAHVVGEARFVRIVLTTGRAILGEVVKVHKARDVALVRVEETGMRALPIRGAPARIGEEVYAVGTPMDRELSTTVTKGIASAYRTDKDTGYKYIQGDVDIHAGNSGGPLVDKSGNIVGISVAGYGVGGFSTGLNLFIPIHDALKALNVTVAAEISAR